MAGEITNAEWRDFQSIPDQGYSHRGWVDARIRERMALAWDEAQAAINAHLAIVGGGPKNPYRP